MQTIYIISTTSTNRLRYVCDVLFNLILKSEYKIVSNPKEIDDSDLVINYSRTKVYRGLQIVPSGLLDESGISQLDIKAETYTGLPTLFHLGEGDIPFDLFAASFYMLSRYEEYLPYKPDIHGRFRAEDSIAFTHKFIELPVVEMWAKLLADKLGPPFPTGEYKQLVTIDIDKAWKYRNNTFIKTVSGLFLCFLKLNYSGISERIAVLSGKRPDPFYTFPYLKQVEEKIDAQIQYFVLLGRKGKYDNATPTRKKEFRELIYRLNEEKNVGIHPSYTSNNSIDDLDKEYYKLTTLIKSTVLHSRQHYLKFTFPYTFRDLINLGIRREYSMGWGSKVGFRAGISRPFPFYDLLEEKQRELYFVPFAAMDRTLKDYMGLQPGQAAVKLRELQDEIKSIGGQFCLLWHNESISDYGEWKGWRSVFEDVWDIRKYNNRKYIDSSST